MNARRTLAVATGAALLLSFLALAFAPPAAGDEYYTAMGGVQVDNRLLEIADLSDDAARLYAVVGLESLPAGEDMASLEALGLTTLPYQHLPFVAVGGTKGQILAAAEVPGVTTLHWNRPLVPLGHAVDPDPDVMFRDTNAFGTGVSSVLADRAWALGVTGETIGVAVLDTGIDTSNPALALSPLGPVVQNVNILSDEHLQFPDRDVQVFLEDQVTTDTFGHGTHVAGSVAGSDLASAGFYLGAAPGAHLIGLKGLQCSIVTDLVPGVPGCLVTILSSFDWILENHEAYNIRVNTNSWGSVTPRPFDPADPISVAVDALVEAGIVVLFAAGNSGPGPNTMTPESRNPKVIGVAASQPSGGLVEFSSRGVPGAETPTVAAPGHLIISTRLHSGGDMDIFTVVGFDAVIPPQFLPNYLVAQGTSMATPVAAGVAALVLSANPELTPAQVKGVFEESATPMLGYGPFEVGAGFVNAEAAVRSVLGMPTKATKVKLPAQMGIGFDTTTDSVVLSHDYRASIAGVGLAGFIHFPFSFPVYTDQERPIEIHLQWETIQPYTVYHTGYRVRVYDPNLELVLQADTDLFTLTTGLTLTVDAETRADRTPKDGAYWYVDMVNFNAGWGILDFTPTVFYGKNFKPPFQTEVVKPFHATGKPDRDAAGPRTGFHFQGSLTGEDGDPADGHPVQVELVDALDVVLAETTTVSVQGHFTAWVPVPHGIPDGTYTLRATAGDLTLVHEVQVDSVAPLLSDLDAAQTDEGTFAFQVAALDAEGLGYVAVLLTHGETGETTGVFLVDQGDGTYAGTLVLSADAPLGAWDVEVYAADRASNPASLTTSLDL